MQNTLTQLNEHATGAFMLQLAEYLCVPKAHHHHFRLVFSKNYSGSVSLTKLQAR